MSDTEKTAQVPPPVQDDDNYHGLANGSQDGDSTEGQKAAANSMSDPSAFPEGGAKAWLTVAGSSACLFVSFGWINCVGVFQEYYQTHQLKQYSASDVAWIPALQSKGVLPASALPRLGLTSCHSFLHVVWRALCGQSLRRLRPSLPPGHGRLPSRFRLDDDEHIKKILPIPPQPSHLLCNRSLDGFLPRIYMRIDMVLRKARRILRPGRSRLIPRRRHYAHHGHSSDSRSRFRLGNADLRLPDTGSAHLRKPNGALSHRALEAPV